MNSFSLLKLHNTCYINGPLMITTNTEGLFRDNSGLHFEAHPSRFFPVHLHTYESIEYLLSRNFHNMFVIYIKCI